jgi:hypothetical protein
MLPAAGRYRASRHLARAIERALKIDLDHGAKAVRTQVFRRNGKIARGIVEKNIDWTRHIFDRIEGGTNGIGIPHVESYLDGLTADGLDRVHAAEAVRFASAQDCNGRAEARELESERLAETSPAARDRDDLSVERASRKHRRAFRRR